jgi:adenine/guanine/hypoxanthine permease
VFLKLATGRGKEVHALLWVTAGAFLIYFASSPIKALFGIS